MSTKEQKFNLLNNLENKQKIFQEYKVCMGFETCIVHIPLNNIKLFEEELDKNKPNGAARLKKIVEQFDGEVIK